MICPNCGYNIKDGKSSCDRCGYVNKSLFIIPKQDSEDEKNNKSKNDNHAEETEYKEIDPNKVRIQNANSNNSGAGSSFGAGSIFDQLFGGGVFGGLFGNIFGDFFEDDEETETDSYDGENHNVDDYGNPIPIDVFDRDFVEIEEVECYDENGNLLCSDNSKNKEKKSPTHKKKNKDKK